MIRIGVIVVFWVMIHFRFKRLSDVNGEVFFRNILYFWCSIKLNERFFYVHQVACQKIAK